MGARAMESPSEVSPRSCRPKHGERHPEGGALTDIIVVFVLTDIIVVFVYPLKYLLVVIIQRIYHIILLYIFTYNIYIQYYNVVEYISIHIFCIRFICVNTANSNLNYHL